MSNNDTHLKNSRRDPFNEPKDKNIKVIKKDGSQTTSQIKELERINPFKVEFCD